MSYLDINNLTKIYEDFKINADLHINKGEFFTLLGPSGCGKTTLLRILAGFISPDKGNIIVNGTDITNLHPRFRNISIVFQNYALFPDRSVYKNISYGPESKKWDKKKISAKVSNLLNVINMENHALRLPETLSGGEKQRTALARAIAAEPDIILLDEPLSALDDSLRNSLRDEIRDIHDKTGLTTVYVTHDQEEALYLSDRICVINNGVIEQVDTPENIYRNPETMFTASFIGESNIIPEDKNSYTFFRPELCEITASNTMTSHNESSKYRYFTARIVKKSFMGSYYRIDALTAGSIGEKTKIILYDYYPCKVNSIENNDKQIFFRVKKEDIKTFSKT